MLVTVTNGATGGVLDSPQLVDGSSSFVLSCNATGSPTPTISWTMDSMVLTSDGNKIMIVESTSTGVIVSSLTVTNFVATDGGVYTCVASNSVGTSSVSSDIQPSEYCLCMCTCTMQWYMYHAQKQNTSLKCRLKSIMLQNLPIVLQNLPIMLFGISPIFCLLCSFLCFLEMHYAFILCFFFMQRSSSCNGKISLQLQHTNNGNSLKLGCAPELVGILEQGCISIVPLK